MERFFVDTSAWIALVSARDAAHASAVRALRSLRGSAARAITTNYVLDEAFTFLARRGGLEAARALRSAVAGSHHAQVVWIGEDDHEHAWPVFEKFADLPVSFTDATSIHIMRRLGIRRAWTYDSDFQRAGFEIIG